MWEEFESRLDINSTQGGEVNGVCVGYLTGETVAE